MKKGLSVILSILLVFGLCVNKVHAFAPVSTLEESYNEVLAYYETTSIMYLDEIIALGNAGIDVSSMPLSSEYCEYDTTQDFSTMGAGFLGKFILASIFMGEDPTNLNGNDLVALLSSKVDENGVIEECINDADDFIWALFALKACNSPLVEKMADVLVSYQIVSDTSEDRDNDKGGFNGAWGVSMDMVGLCIEALSLIDSSKYQDAIALALEYLDRKQGEDAGYDPNDLWGFSPANTDTQACIVEGLLINDKEGVISGNYDTDLGEISDYLLKFQNEDGSFINGGWDLGSSDPNPYSTFAALRALSTYFNGSFVVNANTIFNTPKTPQTPPVEETKPMGPNTADTSNVMMYLFILLLSGSVIKGLKTKHE